MAHSSQPINVKCASAVLLARVPAGVEIKPAAVGLANDFNWKVRLSVAENIENMKMDKVDLIGELVQDEERDVVVRAAGAMASMIV